MSLLLALLALLPPPGKAQPVVGARSGVEEMQGLHAYGQCVANEWPLNVRAALAVDFRDKAYRKTLWNLADKPVRCEGAVMQAGTMGADSLLFAGALAEGMLRRDGAIADLAAKTAHNPALPNIIARDAGEMLAFCVIRTSPGEVAGMLKADPATDEELAAIRAMAPTLSGCVPANSKSEFTRESLRSLLALGAYRLAAYNASSGGAGKEAVK